jgi:PKD repeat protein
VSVSPREGVRRAVGPLLVSALLVVSGLALLDGLPGPISPGSAGTTGDHPLGVTAAAPDGPAPGAPNCNGAIAAYNALYAAGPAPPAVTVQNASACVLGPDEEGVALRANTTLSGSRFEITVALPPLDSSPATILSEFFLTVPVSGIACSYGGQSLMRIDLFPPGAPLGVSGGWTLRAPIWDLAPAGACDPRCQNTTARFPVDEVPFCLDEAAIRGLGAPGFSPLPSFAPGDVVTFTVTNGSGNGLMVYANDSTHRSLSIAWNYSAGSVVGGGTVEPWSSVAGNTGGWSFGGSPGYGWTNCPTVNATGLAGCDSYDPGAAEGLATPSVTNATFWDPSTQTYSLPYTSYVPWSSTAGCAGTPGFTHCLDFATNGGQGAYPGIHVAAASGRAWVSFGANRTDVIGPLGVSSVPANGTPGPVDPVVLSAPSAFVNNTTIILSVRASDPRGIGLVAFNAAWCFAGGVSTQPTTLTVNGTKGPGSANGSEDAIWSASFPRGNNITGGTIYYNVVEYTNPLDAGSPALYTQASIPSSGLTCGTFLVSPPVVLAANATVEGYNVSWFLPPISQAEVENYSVVAIPSAGPPVTYLVAGGTSHYARIGGLVAGGSYTISVGTGLVDGASGPSNPPRHAGPTLSPLLPTLTANVSAIVQPNNSVHLAATVSGGLGPYNYRLSPGDGSAAWINGTIGQVSWTVSYVNYLGAANATVTVYDRAGDAATSATSWIDVRGTPFAVPLTLSAGDDNVALRWSAPASPTSPVTGYEVFYSQSPTALDTMTSAWPTNGSGAEPVYLWNTTHTSFNFSASDGSPVYALVIGWNALGGGIAPQGGPSVGEPATFALASFGPAPGSAYGGPAPFNATVSAATTGGTNNPLTGANYTVTELAPSPDLHDEVVGSNLTSLPSPSGTSAWANATLPLNYTGTFLVQVHLVDERNDPVLIPSFDLYVGVGSAPTVSVTESTQFAFAGHPVHLEALAGGTSGPYLYDWLFGDGSELENAGAAVNHTYAGGGSYMATVTVTDEKTGGAATADVVFTVYAVPTVRIAAFEGTSGSLSFLFQALEVGGSGAPRGLTWQFGDGMSGSGQNASHTYAKAGQYTVTVALSDPAGPNATSSATIFAGVASTAATSNAVYLAAIFSLLLVAVVLAALVVYLFWRGQKRAAESARPMGPSYPTRSEALPPPERAPALEPPEPPAPPPSE